MVAAHDLASVRGWVAESARIVVLTGAGISTDSGIPDYRGPNGVWTKNPKAEKTSDIRWYLTDPEVRRIAWQNRLRSPAWTAEPNAGHEAIVRLHATGRVTAVVTQNIDELHQRSGIPASDVVEVHGTIHRSVCWDCGDTLPMSEVLERVRAGDPDPSCGQCGGILKSDTISFGQPLDPEVIGRAIRAAETADLLLAVGTTLAVGPVNQMVPVAKAAGARVVIVNGEPTAMDHFAHAVVQGSISDLLPLLVRSD
jgi:NAD-dependent deacetylase